MAEQEFIIRALLEFEYRVTAGTADEAELIMEDGGLKDKGTCVGYSVDAVVSADKRGQFWHDEDDLRARCTCGHLVVDQHTGRRFGQRQVSEIHPQACSAYQCDCLRPVEAVAAPA
ncbi:hypothetical protein ABGB18_11300 [Nonomuraea sp. B12E4]|uniref:hypothetical protein n=1 Tax=Nonomuraea sp. B12E4 TaxID=3153564 RepID=UPI00325E9CE1